MLRLSSGEEINSLTALEGNEVHVFRPGEVAGDDDAEQLSGGDPLLNLTIHN